MEAAPKMLRSASGREWESGHGHCPKAHDEQTLVQELGQDGRALCWLAFLRNKIRALTGGRSGTGNGRYGFLLVAEESISEEAETTQRHAH